MPGSGKPREEGDLFPSFLNQTPPDPVHEQTPDRPKRSLTPRGHIFRDFSEAHRNITGSSRLKSTNPFATPPHDSSNDIPLQDLSSPYLPNSNGRMLSDQPSSQPFDFVLPYPQRSDKGRSLTDHKHVSRGSSVFASSSGFEDGSSVSSKGAAAEATDDSQKADTSKCTADKLLDQHVEIDLQRRSSHDSVVNDYLLAFPKPRGRKQNNSQAGRSKSITPCPKPPSQRNNREGSLTVNYQARTPHLTPTHSILLKKTVLDTPDIDAKGRTRPSSHEGVTITDSDHSFIDEDTLRYLRHGHHSLLPSPLRVPSDATDVFSDQIRKPGLLGEVETSFKNGTFFESRSDPFKYDSREYRAALQAAREREVSQALEVGVDVDCALSYPDKNQAGQEGMDLNNEGIKVKPREHLGQSVGNFYDSTTLDALRGQGPKPVCDEADIKVIVMALTAQGHVLNNEEAQNHLFGRDAKKGSSIAAGIPKEATKEGDWVTEATSEVEFDTGATAPFSDDRSSRMIKVTGSSVADVSDHGSDGAPLRRFNSGNHILRHPPGPRNTSPRRYDVHDLKDTEQRVMLPRPNFPRINMFAQNSLRTRPDVPSKPGRHPFPPNMRPQMQNPFTRRRSGYQRAGPSSYFGYARDRTKSSKYDFRDSASSYGQASAMNHAAGDTYGTLPSTSMGSINTQKVLAFANTQANPYDNRLEPDTEIRKPTSDHARNFEGGYSDPGEQYQPAAAVSPADNGTTPTDRSFPFPLLDLREAQELQKKQRESGNTDETEDSTTRYQRAMSGTAGRNTATPTQLQQPRRAYVHPNSGARRLGRASTLSSSFSPPSWFVGGDGCPGPPIFKWFTIEQSPRQPRLLPVDKSARRTGGHAIDEPSITVDESAEADNISPWGCQRRKQFFYMILALSVLPFFGIMALHGSFNTLLASYTEGKVFRFTKKQRRAIKLMLVTEAIICVAIALIVIFVQFSKA
ncbi:hypothetical protein PG999_011676 [Apiospora kogelbergensis]|uniref:Uncharacterized protein n=1 Tax=Apiospora kogelbergensis TaxID=1337665 RepID=A0AAW0QFI7_9PEZI